jgi:hypothetical protein
MKYYLIVHELPSMAIELPPVADRRTYPVFIDFVENGKLVKFYSIFSKRLTEQSTADMPPYDATGHREITREEAFLLML